MLERAAVLPSERPVLQALFSFERLCDVDLRTGVLSRRNGRFVRCWPLLEIAGSYRTWRLCIGRRIDASFRARYARRFAVSPNTKQAVRTGVDRQLTRGHGKS